MLAPIRIYWKVKKTCKRWLCMETSYLTSLPSRVICFLVFLCSGILYLGTTECESWNDWGDRILTASVKGGDGKVFAQKNDHRAWIWREQAPPTVCLPEELVLWYIREEFMHKGLILVTGIVCINGLLLSLSWVLLSTWHTGCLLSAGNHGCHMEKELQQASSGFTGN